MTVRQGFSIPVKRLVKTSIPALFSLLVTILTALLLGLGTQPGRIWLTETLIANLNNSGQIQIEITGLTSPAISQWRAEKLVVSQQNQAWIIINRLRLDWQPKALWRNTIAVQILDAHKVEIRKQAGESLDSDTNRHISWPNFQLEHLSIGSLRLAGFSPEDTAPESFRYSLTGNAEWFENQPLRANMELQSLTEISSKLTLTTRSGNLDSITFTGSLTEAGGGLFGAFLHLPEEQAIDAGFDISLETTAHHFNVAIDKFELPIAGKKLQLVSNFSLEKTGFDLHLQHLDLTVDDTKHSLTGSRINRQLNLHLELNHFPLELVSPWLEPDLTGEVSAQVTVTGTAENPALRGDIEANLGYNQLPVHVEFSGVADKHRIDVDAFTAALAGGIEGARASARGRLALTGADSDLAFSVSNLSSQQLAAFHVPVPDQLTATLTDATGRLRGAIKQPEGELTVVGMGNYQQQDFSLTAKLASTGSQLRIDQASLQALDGAARVQGTLDIKTFDADLAIELSALPLSAITFAGMVLPDQLSGTVDANLTLREKLQNPLVAGDIVARGFYQEVPLKLDFTGRYQASDIQMERLGLQVSGEQTLTANGYYRPDGFQVSANAAQFPAQLLTALGWHLKPGKFSADLKAHGTADNPALSGQLHYESTLAGFNTEGEETEIGFVWDVNAGTSQGFLNLDATLSWDKRIPSKLLLQIPLKTYLDYFADYSPASKGPELPMAGNLDGTLDLQTLSFLIDPDLHRLNGSLATRVALGGTISNPEVDGHLELQQGRYINRLNGTWVQNINCRLNTRQATLRIQHCQATDQHQGSYELGGQIRLPGSGDHGLVDVTLIMNGVSILRRPEIESEASGEITLRGDFSQLLAAGQLDVSPFTAHIDSTTHTGVPRIEVEEIYAGKTEDKAATSQLFRPPSLKLDILLSASRQAYLRGLGLAAELQGKIRVNGDARKPDYDGELTVVRGTFEIFDKLFKLERGEVRLVNDALFLSISGAYRKAGQQVRAEITGTADQFELLLSSTPAMTQDEILAFIIFGKPLPEITPFEALQLANAVQQLRGGKALFDPLTTTRKLLGVDRLSVEAEKTETGDTGVNVGVGKYLNEKVYLELEHTPHPAQPWKGSLQIEIAPNVNLESSTGGESGIEGVGLKWKRDY